MFTHIIKPHDTFALLADQDKCLINDLMCCNLDLDPKTLQLGDKIYVPESKDRYVIGFCLCVQFVITSIIYPLTSRVDISLPRLSSAHKIKANDTISSLSRYYGCSETDIMSVNPGLIP